jgi:hypothetical protein
MKSLQTARLHGTRLLASAVLFCVTVAMGTGIVGGPYAAAQSRQRSVQGRVVSATDVPIPDAIVYLSDTRTKAVTSYITREDGAYRFEQLSPNDDYKLWAQLNEKRSKTKTLSSFDGRSVFHVILTIETSK